MNPSHRDKAGIDEQVEEEAVGTVLNRPDVRNNMSVNDIIVHGNGATLWVFYGIPHQAVLDTIANVADVVIDQYTSLGIYGYVSVEAMALGKPALSTLRRDLYPYDCPVIYPRVTKLMELARDEGYRKWLGERGRAYAGRVYDARQVATKSIDAYDASKANL